MNNLLITTINCNSLNKPQIALLQTRLRRRHRVYIKGYIPTNEPLSAPDDRGQHWQSDQIGHAVKCP